MATQVLQFNQAQQAVLNVINVLNGRTFLCRIANPAGRLTVVQKGGPENKKVDQKLGMIFCILSTTIRPTIIKVLLQSLLLASN